jgi:hypothetical protein
MGVCCVTAVVKEEYGSASHALHFLQQSFMLATIQSRTLFSNMLSKNVKIGIYKTIVLPVVLFE